MITNNNNLSIYHEQGGDSRKPFEISPSKTAQILKNILYIGWYIKEYHDTQWPDFNYIVKFDFFKSDLFTVIDTISLSPKDKAITFLNDNKFSLLTYKKFTYQLDMDPAREIHATTSVNFADYFQNEKNIDENVQTDILQRVQGEENNNIFLLDIEQVSTINLLPLDAQFRNPLYTDEYFLMADGDMANELVLSSDGTAQRVFLPKPLNEGTVRLEFDASGFPTDTLKLDIDGSSYMINDGNNVFNITSGYNGASLSFYTDNGSTTFTRAKLKHFIYNFVSNNNICYTKIRNNNVSLSQKYLVENHGSQMPDTTAQINSIDFAVEKNNDYQITTNYEYNAPIGQFPDFSEIEVEGNNMRVDNIERSYSNGNVSSCQITLTGKY